MKKKLQETLELNKQLQKSGLQINQFGNASIRYNDLCLIKPSGADLKKITHKDISVVKITNKKFISGLKPSVDLNIHLELYKKFNNIKSIVHTHSLYASSWAQSGRQIPCYGTTHADYYPKEIPITNFPKKNLIKDDYEREIGISIIKKLNLLKLNDQKVPGILVANHGVVSWGSSPKLAMENANAIEFIAQLAFNAEMLNKKTKRLPVFLHMKHYNRKHGKKSYYGQK
jgi:L-ribulose-5-phosphate 4-epimerase